MSRNGSSRNGRKRRVLRWGLAAAVVFAAAAIALPYAAVNVANRLMAAHLKADARLVSVKLRPWRGYVGLNGLCIEQPEGFGSEPLLQVGHARVDLKMPALLRGKLIVQEVALEDVFVRVGRNADGVLNTDALIEKPTEKEEVPAEEPVEPEAAKKPVALVIRRADVRNGAVSYFDLSGSRPLDVRLDDIRAEIRDLLFDADRVGDGTLPGWAVVRARIRQGEPAVDSELGLSARVGALGDGVPAVNAVLRLVGFELATIGPLVPIGVRQALGGRGLDVHADLALASDVLDCRARIMPPGNVIPFALGGTPGAPVVRTGDVLGTLLFRAGGGLGSLAENVGGGALRVGEAGLDGTVAVAKGAGRVVGSVGRGLFETARGAVQGDLRAAGEGLKGTAVGTAGALAGTVTNTAGVLTGGLIETAGTAVGTERMRNWRGESAQRWQAAWQEALDALMAMPYPRAAE